jgi:oligoendopeptidase F
VSGPKTSLESSLVDLGVADVRWDHRPLVVLGDDVGVDALLDRAEALTKQFQRHRGTFANIGGEQFGEAMRELAAISELLERAGASVYLSWTVDVDSPETGAAMAKNQERQTAIATQLLFVDVEWGALSDEAAAALMAHDSLAFCRHWLSVKRSGRPFLLSEPEEKIVAEKYVTGVAAWTRLYDEQVSAIRVALGPDRIVPV